MKHLRWGPFSGTLVLCILLVTGLGHAESSSTSTGVSRLMNPAISVNGLFLAQTSSDDPSAEANRIALQEAEMQLTAVVDPFWRADLIVAWHEEHEEGDTDEHSHGPHYATDIEAAVLRSTAMPGGLGLSLGKFFLPFGKHAPLHTHQFPFVSAPVAIEGFLGDHGLNDTGVAVDATLPLPWYAELTVYGVSGQAGIFNAEHRDLVYGGRLSNLWDVSDNATLELGGSAFTGKDANSGEFGTNRLNMFGADVTYKWSSGVQSQGPALNWTNEVILPDPEHGLGDPIGFYSHLQYRFHRNWWLGLGGGLAEDVLLHDEEDEEETTKDHDHVLLSQREYKANLTWTPSEFSALRAEVSYLENTTDDTDDLRFSLQWNFTIGSHPAHLY